MNRIFNRMRTWVQAFVAAPRPADPLESMSPRELADLPASHPASDPGRR